MIEKAKKPVIYIDTNIFIANFEQSLPASAPLRVLFDALQVNPYAAATSEITIAELPAVRSSIPFDRLRELYNKFLLQGSFIEMRPVTLHTLLEAAEIRQMVKYKLPDAIHVVTALDAGCKFFVSAGTGMSRIEPHIAWIQPDASGIEILLDILRA